MLLHIEFLSMINLRCIVLIEMSNGRYAAEAKNRDDFSGIALISSGTAILEKPSKEHGQSFSEESRRDFHTTTDSECAA